MSDYRLKVAVQNANILRAIEAAGFKSTAEMCRLFGLQVTTVAAYINFRIAPTWGGQSEKAGELRDTAEELCLALGVLPEDLWTDEQLGMKLPRNALYADVRQDELEEAIRQIDHRKMIKAIKAKTKYLPRHEAVIDMRFSQEEPTLEETAVAFDVTRERIRQMEAKMMGKYRGAALKAGGVEVVDLD